MKPFSEIELPFKSVVSFEAVIEQLEKQLEENNSNQRIKDLLERIKHVPELKSGFSDFSFLQQNSELVSELLSDLFPLMLTQNEIKAATIPLSNLVFNPTKRFEELLKEAGKEFQISDTNFADDEFYIASCCIILTFYYHVPYSNTYPLYFNMTDKRGVEKYYRILYNADFLKIYPTENTIELTQKDIESLLDNFEDIKLWKEKIPPQSWMLKGFGIMSLYDATIETSVSNLKQELLNKSSSAQSHSFDSIEKTLKSIFNLPNLSVGMSDFNFQNNHITPNAFKESVKSQLLSSSQDSFSIENSKFLKHINERKVFVISNVERFLENNPEDEIAIRLQKSGSKSAILVPMSKGEKFFGIIEFTSLIPEGFNSVVAQRIDLILSFLIDAMERSTSELSNLTDALIQKEYTSIHPSVAWKFRREAENYIRSYDKEYTFKEITFKDVYALYGEVDIKNSSIARNDCVKEDIQIQLRMLIEVMDELKAKTNLMLLEQRKFELETYLNNLNLSIEAGTEQEIQQYISNEVHPILANLNIDKNEDSVLTKYLKSLNPITGLYYHSRKNFEDTISIINKKLANILDERQKEIQEVFPHYFERFKTDGIEHNIYIGASITPNKKFDLLYLYNLRLWQLQAICDMVNEHHRIKSFLPIPLEMTSLILSFSQPLSIRFRMDEKRFDVDGTYNARYEIVKKRIDKAFEKDKKERITQPGKITIVYMHSNEETEYLKYIKFLQYKNILDSEIEFIQVENLQGITGLKAIRVKIKYREENTNLPFFTYKDLVQELE